MDKDMCPFGEKTQKYWDRRHDLFTKFDDGIQLDEEALFSAMPETMAHDIIADIPNEHFIDAMCGGGIVSIAAALAGKKVTAIDIDAQRIENVRYNAKIYGVDHQIEFVCADILDYLRYKQMTSCAIFFDPPWGGPEYYKKEYMLNDDFLPSLQNLINTAQKSCGDIFFNAPKNYDFNQLQILGDNFTLKKRFKWDRFLATTVQVIN